MDIIHVEDITCHTKSAGLKNEELLTAHLLRFAACNFIANKTLI